MVSAKWLFCLALCLGVAVSIETWEKLNAQALEEAHKGDWEKALEAAKKSLGYKSNAPAHHLIAQVHLVHSRVEDALDSMRTAFSIQPSTALKAEVKFHEAVVLQYKRDYKGAVQTFKESIDILEADKSVDPASLEKVAIAVAALGDVPTAVGYLKKLWNLSPQYKFHNGLPFVRIADKYDDQIEQAGKRGQSFVDSVIADLSNITAVTNVVYMDIAVGNRAAKRIEIALYGKAAPRAVKNFLDLTTCVNAAVCYTGSTFHRVIKDFIIQGGDITSGDGTGRVNTYGRPFADDVYALALMHDGPGIVQMANSGPDTNGGQFVVMANAAAHLNGNHVVIGRVVKGMDVVTEANQVEVDEKHAPKEPVIVVKCGEVH